MKGCSLQWSGRACTASAAKQDGLEPRAEGHQPCPTADFQCSEMKDESVRNQAGNLIFSKETMDRISVFPSVVLIASDHLSPGHRDQSNLELALSVL